LRRSFTLALEIGVRPPTITKTISRLQAQGFLEKRGSESDARQAHIFLTEAGHDAIVSIEKSIKKTEKRALDGLDKKDRKTLSKLLRKVEGNLTGMDLSDADKDDEPDDVKTKAAAEEPDQLSD
jgi:DNA-binding PadR family transcriptional regulator